MIGVIVILSTIINDSFKESAAVVDDEYYWHIINHY